LTPNIDILPDLPVELAQSLEEKWEAFNSVLEKLPVEMSASSPILNDLKKCFIFSEFIFKNLTRNPHLIDGLIKKGDLYRAYEESEYARNLSPLLKNCPDEKTLTGILRDFRNREMVRIAFRDLIGLAPLLETMADLSALADTCIEQTFSYLHKLMSDKYGAPCSHEGEEQRIVVLGLGKLGSRELNFSSDVDLMFAFPKPGKTVGKSDPISNEEYFLQLCRAFLKVFSGSTSSGTIFRVDLRLRPFGENGPLIMNFNSLEEYYEAQGREWERYAMIKIRVVAGHF